jgi:hypothetical protein
VNCLRDNPMTQFSIQWNLSLNRLSQNWGQVQFRSSARFSLDGLIEHRMAIVIPILGLPMAAIVASAIVLSSCAERPEYVRLPQQYQPSSQNDFLPDLPLLTMGTNITEENAIEGVYGTDNDWPWSNEHPSFVCFLKGRGPWRFVLHFATVKTTLRNTGPITISVRINDVPFSKVVVSRARVAEYTRDVPAEMAISGVVHVALTIQPFWTKPGDGQRLGILIRSIGFRRRPG